jgi:hypothetical protein
VGAFTGVIPCPADAKFVDIHYHAGVDTLRRRRTVIQAGEAYAALSGWVVVKSHIASTTATAWEARQHGLPVSGSVVLNHLAGGLDPRVIEHAVLTHGPDAPTRPIVYLPTITGKGPATQRSPDAFHPEIYAHSVGLPVCGHDGRLLPATVNVIACCADLPVVLATGHSTREEVLRVVDCAVASGVSRIVVTHATHPMVGLTIHDLRDLADIKELYIELTGLTYILGRQRPDQLMSAIRAHPRVILSSDLGQTAHVDVTDWLPWTDSWLRLNGIAHQTIREILVTHPAGLIST